MAHPGSELHQEIIDSVRVTFGRLFDQFKITEVAGLCTWDSLSSILTNQIDQKSLRIKHPAAYPDLVLWCDEGGTDLSVVIIEVGKFNNIHKLSKLITDPIIHIGFDWTITPIRCNTGWSQSTVNVLNELSRREQTDNKRMNVSLKGRWETLSCSTYRSLAASLQTTNKTEENFDNR